MCNITAFRRQNHQDPVTGELYPVSDHDHDDHRTENLVNGLFGDDLDD